MIKLKLDSDKKLVQKYVDELKTKLPGFDVNVRNANDFEKMLEEKNNCHSCNGLNFCSNEARGFCYSYTDNQFSFVECKYKRNEKKIRSKQSLIKTLYLPSKILDATFENYHLTSESRKKIYKETINFINNFKNNSVKTGFYIYGNFSIGKTYTLACIANELAKNNVSCLLIYFPDLVVDLKNAIGTSRFELLINMLKSIDVLMLDDLGSENMSPWLRDDVLGPILNYRVLENKPLFISSNIKPEQLKRHFNVEGLKENMKADRILSRLYALSLSISMDDSEKFER